MAGKDLDLIEQTLGEANDTLDILSELILEYTFDKNRDVKDVVKLYYDVDQVKRNLTLSISSIEDLLNKLMAVSEVRTLPDVGVQVEKKQGKQRTQWDHPTVRSVLSEKILENHLDEDGALDVPPSRLIEEAFDYTGLSWKLTKLRELGLKPDKYCVKKDGRISYGITRLAEAEEVKEEDDDDFI